MCCWRASSESSLIHLPLPHFMVEPSLLWTLPTSLLLSAHAPLTSNACRSCRLLLAVGLLGGMPAICAVCEKVLSADVLEKRWFAGRMLGSKVVRKESRTSEGGGVVAGSGARRKVWRRVRGAMYPEQADKPPFRLALSLSLLLPKTTLSTSFPSSPSSPSQITHTLHIPPYMPRTRPSHTQHILTYQADSPSPPKLLSLFGLSPLFPSAVPDVSLAGLFGP